MNRLVKLVSSWSLSRSKGIAFGLSGSSDSSELVPGGFIELFGTVDGQALGTDLGSPLKTDWSSVFGRRTDASSGGWAKYEALAVLAEEQLPTVSP
jgi:hypothetical protein